MAASSRLRLETVTTDERVVVVVHGELAAGESPALTGVVTALLDDAEVSHLEIDLAATRFVDSSGIGALAGAIRAMASRGGRTTLRASSERVREVIVLAGLGEHMAD